MSSEYMRDFRLGINVFRIFCGASSSSSLSSKFCFRVQMIHQLIRYHIYDPEVLQFHCSCSCGFSSTRRSEAFFLC